MHPDEKDYIKNNAERYAKQKGISVDQAQQELTAQADRQVQSGSPGAWDQDASEFLSHAKGMLGADGYGGLGYMFYATPEQKANPNIYAEHGGQNIPSANDLAAAVAREQAIQQNVSNATLGAAGLAGAIAGAGPLSGAAMDVYAAYKAAAAGYSPGTALGTGAAVSGGFYTLGVGAEALKDYYATGQNIVSGFEQRFSYPGLATAMAVGAPVGMYSTAMFSWAGVPNALGNWLTLPGFIIRANSTMFGNVAGQAAQGAVKQSTNP
ncbi:hypothetical protein [Collimonas antrihumi]|uniref:hypothetical protein n=1 Tax=Collimonas antrihumi TaxID=1940615 RepID=UPI001B8D1C85|nr:hypothetical protein [Collimonas antrihumi]